MSLPVHLASEQFLLKTQKYTNISQHLFTAKKEKKNIAIPGHTKVKGFQ